ncbi:n6-DNA-methyltransferase, putative [Entamoeba invadens IP1]|uniref:N6-DNA-methyltransferase, putative n=1 Tax=Entamoeba invadens IP1 TaxID=370355 RepID=A0A0A1UGX1_ENTIV|nr:n6-DNA-methyltransferase, putative [Entamoeba invadens IP1]ELP95239.1 n6-DNA-methyltransferase, putative [Entamoeba invadens IP1]|eukprot:XP_004262010.1 n6-DNA-methyltransferase, putative [Entamoeba invadens IP1]
MSKYPVVGVPQSTWENVYKPEVDTYLLMDALTNEIEYIKERKPAVSLEIGCGSGIVSAHIQHLIPSLYSLSSDINPFALACAQQVHPSGNFLKMSLLDGIRDESVDLFIYNPPYVPTPEEELHSSYIALSWAGGKDGREKIDCVIERLWDILTPTGVAYIVLVQDNNPKEIFELAAKHYLTPKVIDSVGLQTEKLYIVRFTPRCAL